MSTQQAPRSLDEIVRLHDQFEAILLGEAPVEITDEEREEMSVITATLCWILGHPAGLNVRRMQVDITRRAETLGYFLRPLPVDDPRRKGRGPKEGR